MPSTQQTVDRLKRLWQKRLALRDWDIEVKLVDKIDHEGSWGACRWWCDTREAVVQIERGPWPFSGLSLEETLVHELLHVAFQGHRKWRGYRLHDEIAFNTTARALVAGYRGRNKET